jgi:hypothetical protein
MDVLQVICALQEVNTCDRSDDTLHVHWTLAVEQKLGYTKHAHVSRAARIAPHRGREGKDGDKTHAPFIWSCRPRLARHHPHPPPRMSTDGTVSKAKPAPLVTCTTRSLATRGAGAGAGGHSHTFARGWVTRGSRCPARLLCSAGSCGRHGAIDI